MAELLAYGILLALVGLAVVVCSHEQRRKYRGLKLPKRRR